VNSHLAFERLLSETFVERFGWALVHSLWQFALVAAVAGAIVRTMRRKSSAARYGVLVVAMALSVTAPLATWVLQPGNPSVSRAKPVADASAMVGRPIPANATKVEIPTPDSAASSAGSSMPPPVSPPGRPDLQHDPSWSEQLRAALQPWLAWIVAGWSLGVAVCSLRPLLGWYTLRRLRRVGVLPASDEVLATLRRASARLGLRRAVRVGQSTLARVPILVGYLRPVVLLPVSLVTSIPTAQLEAILAHELAHVRRHDFVVNLLQTLVETLFFYHPAVWWISRQIRVEREHCCDDLVVKLLDNRVEYGRALVAIEQIRGRNSVLALGATDGSLLSRVRRIVGFDSERTAWSLVDRGSAALLVLTLIGALFALTVNWNLAAEGEGRKQAAGAEARAEQETATVLGTVVSPDGKPVAGVEIVAFEGAKQLQQKFTTDENGEFRVPKAWREVDEWLTVVARDGRERLGWFDFMIHGHSDLGQKSEDGSFRLVLLPMSRTIRGRILDESGRPLAQIPVRINQLEHEVNATSVHWSRQKLGDEPLLPGAVSDNGGRFEVKLPANTFAWLGTSHPDWVEKKIRVTREQDEVADTSLVRAAKVAGRVIDARTGKPLAGVTIGAFAAKTDILESGGDDAKTDASGNYLIRGLRSGEHTIQFLEGADKTLTAPAYAKAILKSGETFQADFSLSVGRHLTGRVVDIDTGEPIPNCQVTYNGPAHPETGLSTETNPQGEFEFFVPPGRSRLDATEGRRFGNDSIRTVDVQADSEPEPVVLKVGERIEPVPGSFKIFMGPPLDRKVSLNFKDTPLVEALNGVCNSAGMILDLDQAALTSAGYSKDTPINLAESKLITLRDALTLILKRYEKLSFTVDKNLVFVSSPEGVEVHEKRGAEPKPPAEEEQEAATSPPKGLEFLTPYPKLHGLSLDMSEKQFMEIVKKMDLKTRKTAEGETFRFRIALGDDHTLIATFRKDGTCSGIQRVRGEDAADENVSLAELVRDFNAENNKLKRGLDQPPLTEDEVVAAIQRSEWDQWRLRGAATTDDWTPGERNRSEREFAVFKSVAETRQLPKETYFAVWTSEEPSTFVVNHVWSIQLFLPSLDGDGFDGFSIRHTKLGEEKFDPKSVAWGEPDADGLSLGAYLSPNKAAYQIGERVRLRLFVRNEGTEAVKVAFANTTHPMPNAFNVTDEKGAKVAVRIGHDQWSLKWISGFMGGELGPGDVHAFHVPFELGIGGDGTNKLIGRVIDARPGQTLQLRVREHNGNNRTRTDDEPQPESGAVMFRVVAGAPPAGREAAVAVPEKPLAKPDVTAEIAANGEIVGSLIDASTGKPVEGATIACGAVINESGGGGANAITNAEGRYRLTVPSPGIYNVWLQQFDKDPTMTAAADDGILVEAGRVAASKLRLVVGRKVGGKVVDSDNKPFAKLDVSCYSAARPMSGGIQLVESKADGTFEFFLPSGRAYVYVTEYVKRTNDNPFGIGRSAHAYLNVSATDDVAPITLTLQKFESKFGDSEWLKRSTPGTSIVRREGKQDVTGAIVDDAGKPIAGAKVFREDGPIVSANGQGEFRVETLKGTQFVMHAFAPGYHVWFGTPTSGDVLKVVLEPKR